MIFGKLGRQPAQYRTNTPRLASYMLGAIPAVPSVDYTTALTIPWGMLMNDVMGNCTIAAVGHLSLGFSLTEQDPRLQMMSDQEAQVFYEIIGKYVLDDPMTDNGCLITDVLDYWKSPGIRINTIKNQIFGYTYLSPRNIPLMRYALRHFGGLYIGIMLPQSAEDNMKYWDVGGNTNILGGHCITLQGVDDNNDFYGITWGERVRISPAFLATYCDEMYCVRNDHFKNVDGLNTNQLNADLAFIHKQPLG